jgi:serine/threonine-protein kinase
MIVGNSFHGLMHKIGRYQVEHELGRGAMGIVYRAFDPAIGRRIAIKTIRLELLGDEASRALLRDRLLREAQSAGILSHPNIVTIYDVSEDHNNAYIFMEFVEGTTLEHFSRGMPTAELLGILEQTAAALDYAHARGIVHRDIKPGNLMLSGTQVKITDFGIARLQHRDATLSGNLLGTPSYMSPEQVGGGEVTGASDQYALAVIAYEYLSGSRPFDNDNLANLLYKITQAPVPPVPTLNAATNQVLTRALSKSPAHRYPNCVTFVDALSHALNLEPPRFTPQREVSGDEPTVVAQAPAVNLPPLNLPETPPKSSPVRIVLGVLVGAAAVVSGILWFAPKRPEPAPVTVTAPAPVPEAAKPTPVGEKIPEPVTPPAETREQTKPVAQPVTNEPYEVLFLSSPAGAEVLVNNGEIDRCPKTPCTLLLPAGKYRIRMRLAGFDDSLRVIEVPALSRLNVEFEQTQGTIIVNSNPTGATVKVNGQDAGQKTPATLKLAPGKYSIEVSRDGLPTQSQDVNVRSGVIQTLAINWN